MTEIIRRTWAEIDLDALAHNYRRVREATDQRAKVCCVVKADGYGHGALRIAAELQSLGADWFAVSNLEEALQLRRGGIERPILVLGFTPPEEAAALSEGDVSQCVYSAEYAEKLSLCAKVAGVKVKIHAKIDTGMSRLGFYFQDIFRDEGAIDEVIKACSLPGLIPEGVFSHFAVSDEGKAGDAFTMRQFGCFKEMSEALVRAGVGGDKPPLRHCANSAAVFDYPLSHLDMVRAGVVLYGLYPSGQLRARPDLRPVLSLRSVVSHVKTLLPGATVSYGRRFTAQQETRVATVPVGYADGYPRALGPGGAVVLIRGQRCPVLGRICMDQLMADVSGVEGAAMGDRVTLIGRDGTEEITAGEVAGWEGTINYEVVCALSKRVPRVYLKGGRVESIYNQLLTE
ncbi:alanine racemase [Acutalibacter muris]|uniref:Alanine racemase n=1 Tax=Acutalibacter muris TaxID=1796620 RepID=A0A1Z2XLL6_9FIRM|nr:alanine racemase [Acutalibacter muris]ANU53990.1 alanine racemase [Hungateiclostridiaceae bacterium KB18]ASB39329.1 alanine racemase [Acutalibacter muris]QQR28619.1 alanine racemase [Acutalibacter muris]